MEILPTTSNGLSDNSLVEETIGGDDCDDEELVEPRFRYKRILGDLMRLMENDAASCFTIHDKVLVVGFQSGRVCLFDHIGNVNIDSCSRHHKCAVSCISIDEPANYIISCANDFTVVIFGIGCAEYNQRLTLKYSPKVVVIAPDFSRPGSGQRFLTAAQDLVLYERGVRAEFFSGKRRETVLYKGAEKDGSIWCVSWKETMIAFTNETGTRVYDMRLSRCITLIQPIHKRDKFPISKFLPKHAWLNSTTIAIGWANTLCICGIFQDNRRTSITSELFELPKKYGQILHKFELSDFIVAGISYSMRNGTNSHQLQPLLLSAMSPPLSMTNLTSPVSITSPNASTKNLQTMTTQSVASKSDWEELILFGIKKCGNSRESSLLNFTDGSISTDIQNISNDQVSNVDESTAFSAQLLLIKPISLKEFFIEAEDTIEMRNVSWKNLHRFTLCSLPLDEVYFILSPREAIEAYPCSIDNRISWMMENGLFEEAFESAVRNSALLSEHSVLEVGKRLVNHLIEQKDYHTAAGYLPEVCSKHKEEWAFYVNEFEQRHQVLKLVPVIPTKDPQLEPENYESILIAALYTRPKLFNAIVSQWDADIYRAGHVVSEVFKRITADNENRKKRRNVKDEIVILSEQDRFYLMRALASLLLQCRKYDDAIKTFILNKDTAIFGAIDRHKLFPYVKESIMDLMNLNQDLAIRLLLDNEDLISHEKVVHLLGNHPKIQLAYLHRLQARGEGTMYSDQLVKLYAEHDRPSLLPFLRKNEYYKLDLALEICKRKDYIEEVVYLLGRSGNRLGALELMVNKLLRIDMAIDFCAENDDIELWERLIQSAINRPEQITTLLKRMASIKISSLEVVEKIPIHMDIPDLRQCLLQVLRDHEQQRELLRHSREVANTDVLQLLEMQLKPIAIVAEQIPSSSAEMKCAACHTSLIETSKSNEFLLLADGRLIHEKCNQGESVMKRPQQHTVQQLQFQSGF